MGAPYTNEFAYLFRQICIQDCYHLREIPFTPSIVLDIGANVGVFTSYARFMFPCAKIIALEPDARNWALLVEHTGHLPDVKRLHRALGTGPILHYSVPEILPPYFGGGQRYLSVGQLGLPQTKATQDCDSGAARSVANIRVQSLDDLVAKYVPSSAVTFAKIDIEGAENCIFNHVPSMTALRRIDYVTMEVHYPVDSTGPEHEPDKPTIRQSLMSLMETHDCILDETHNYFQATRKALA